MGCTPSHEAVNAGGVSDTTTTPVPETTQDRTTPANATLPTTTAAAAAAAEDTTADAAVTTAIEPTPTAAPVPVVPPPPPAPVDARPPKIPHHRPVEQKLLWDDQPLPRSAPPVQNRLSPVVSHSSLAAVRIPTTTSSDPTGRAAAKDQKDNDADDDADTTTVNVVLQKITEGGEEAIHHLRNIFATPISFAVHAVSRGFALTSSQPPHVMPQYPKTDLERHFLQTVLQKHYLFDSQAESSLQKLINAFEICTIDVHDPTAITVHDDLTNTTQYHVPIIQEGDEVVTQPTAAHPVSNAYFYVVYHGQCQFSIDEAVVGYANAGDAFGELALLYNGPRAATVTAILQENDVIVEERDKDDDDGAVGIRPPISSTISVVGSSASESLRPTTTAPAFPDCTVVLFRVHQRSFRMILQQDDQDNNSITMNLLENMEFLKGVPLSVKENLARVMVPFPFSKGDHIVQKGIMDCPWYVIERGAILAANLEYGYQDFTLKEGECFGERAIMTNSAAIGDAFAVKDGVAFTVDHETFKALLGHALDNNSNVISRQQDCAKLKAISVLSGTTQTNNRVLNYLSKQITDQTFGIGEVICRAGEPLPHLPSLYLVRRGKVRLDYPHNKTVYAEKEAYFGDDQLKADMGHRDGKYISPYTATVIEECTCGILKLRDCRNVIDTRRMGEEGNAIQFDSLSLMQQLDRAITMNDLSVHRMIGAGTFGQVHLVSRPASDGTQYAYALKVQSKYELCQSGQAKGVVREKKLMTLFHHPFVAKLLASFQDEKCVYMVMNLLQGGELYSVMHTKTTNTLPEKSAKFYVACVAEALFYLHCSHSLVFRDLKPENVMIDDRGYAILIDFGFCKEISGKTYTTCGTPLYLAPEVILNRGHSWSVDYWSLGVMIYEMLVGKTPFYEHGMNKAELFQNIVRGKVYPPVNVSPEVLSLLSGLLRRDPAKRLGSLIGAESDIIDHPWFSDIDRDRLFLKELDAPFLPTIKDPFDSSNFSSWKHVEDKRFLKYPALTQDEKMIFNDF